MAKSFDRKKWLISQLRRLSIKYPPRLKVLNAAKKTFFITAKNGNLVKRVSFTCQLCKTSDLKQPMVQVDHTVEVIGPEGFTTMGDFVDRLFCDESNLKLLCISCHQIKTKLNSK